MGLSTSHSSASRTVKVLIVDDSAFMRASLVRMVESDYSLCVAGTAETGLEAIAKIGTLHPDVVTLDIDMPGLNGLETLKRIMSESPLPVIIVSSLARKGAAATIEALSLGAFDCIAKQLSYAADDVIKVQDELIAKIKAAAGLRLYTPTLLPPSPLIAKRPQRTVVNTRLASATVPPKPTQPTIPASTKPTIIAIATSTGGPKALQDLLSALPADLPVGILVVQHMPVGFIGPLAERLDTVCHLQVHEAKERDLIKPGHVYMAPSGKHMTVRRHSASEVFVHLTFSLGESLHTPSADVMMSSVAEVFHSAAMGIVLTGMGNDGTAGMQAIFREGGLTLGQDQASCVVYGMPRSCAESGVLSQVVALDDIPLHILAAVGYRKPRHRGAAGT